MGIEEFESRMRNLEDQVRNLNDIENIKKLQRAYGFYLEHILYNEVAELWTDDGEMEWIGWGVFKGKDAIRNAWKVVRQWPPEAMHMAIQLSPFITIAPDGQTANGRWYCIGGSPSYKSKVPVPDVNTVLKSESSKPKGESITTFYTVGLYEMDYIKQNGVWKIKAMHYGQFYMSHFIEEPTSPEIEAMLERMSLEHGKVYQYTTSSSRVPRQEWPSPWIHPFHFKHPVTGKETSENEWNKSHPVRLPRVDEDR